MRFKFKHQSFIFKIKSVPVIRFAFVCVITLDMSKHHLKCVITLDTGKHNSEYVITIDTGE